MSNSVQASRTRGRVIVEGPLRVGSDVLLSGNSMRGDVALVKRVSVSADGFYPVRVPGCNVINIEYNQEVATQSTAAALRVGTSASDTAYGSVAISAVGHYQLALTPLALVGVASGATLQVSVTAVGTAGAQVGSLYISYVQTGSAD